MATLVTYATAHDATRGVAERIGEQLRRHGLIADVRAMTEGMDVGGYSATVVGSAVHGGRWLPAATEFLQRNTAVLRRQQVWLFSVSTLGDEESMFPPRMTTWLRALRRDPNDIAELRAAVLPLGHRNFAGVIARSHWPVLGRAAFRIMGGRYGDHRNWPAIDAWADDIAERMSEPTHRLAGPGR